MKTLNVISGTQLREIAELIANKTGIAQPRKLYFVQLDDEHAVDNTGVIFQIVDKEAAKEVEDVACALQYEGESGVIYNYAEDSADFEEDSEDLDIYSHCKEQAELLYDEKC